MEFKNDLGLVGKIAAHSVMSGKYKDKDGNPRKKYMSLRQGCAVSAFLANVVLFEVDKQLSTLDGYFVRYSDDMLYIGHDWQKAMEILKVELQKIGLQLNPRKFSPITDSQWFNFLGFSIKGGMVSLSPSQIIKFQKEICQIVLCEICFPRMLVLRTLQLYAHLELFQEPFRQTVLKICKGDS